MSANGCAVLASVNTRQKFRDNKIDLDVLADLTDGDLEKLGIPLGDRKRLLKAIAELCAARRRVCPVPTGGGRSCFAAADFRAP